ncbi:MAG: epimerase [Sulfuricurvum sp. MLSB]|uniref:SDR family oxidoreductase n=1 Tax=unclassified Sulfuricurvum TaxID=2632390 RepID=UPI0005043823|nr:MULTISPECIES: SDR family oxidoreductase [unclassified Sulfuricurvum]KFN39203.1 MAG: epimerase [Sulfuricurvum sp. MLSB]
MTILLTGANGYIGRRLKHRLLQMPQIRLRLFVKHGQVVMAGERCEIVEGSTFDTESLERALKGIDTAYYLIHSMESANYRELDRQSATNFRDACIRAGVKRIIYLGGLGEKESASEHLLSRIETGEILSARPDQIQTFWFRAGVIIGSGSASFEIIRNLVEKLPFMITPKWVNTLCQPTAERDVIEYLALAAALRYEGNIIIDIGSERMSYKELLLGYAHAVGLERVLVPVPFFTPKLSSYWLTLMTPVPYSVASALIEGLKSEVLVKNDNASRLFPAIRPMKYEDAVKAAVEEIKNTQVLSRWSDTSGTAWEVDHSALADAVFTDRQVVTLGGVEPSRVYATFCSVGGDRGWFGYELLWGIRGFIDKLVGGYGLSRGRRDPHTLRIGDSIDFWKVVDLQENERLLLYAQMKLPGKAWLEWRIKDGSLYQTAYFYPQGLAGRLYWYALIPFHFLVFKGMINSLMNEASKAPMRF